MKLCPACSRPLPDDELADLLTPLQAKLYKAVAGAGWPGINHFEIAAIIYRDDPDGGAETDGAIKALIWKINKRLRPRGIRISAAHRRESRYGPGLYELIRLEEPACAS